MASDSNLLGLEHLAVPEDDGTSRAIRQAGRGNLKDQMAAVEKVLIEEALTHNKGNRTHAAKRLGITRQALLVKLNKYGISKETKKQ
jgi:two-component system NtrC family response regulator